MMRQADDDLYHLLNLGVGAGLNDGVFFLRRVASYLVVVVVVVVVSTLFGVPLGYDFSLLVLFLFQFVLLIGPILIPVLDLLIGPVCIPCLDLLIGPALQNQNDICQSCCQRLLDESRKVEWAKFERFAAAVPVVRKEKEKLLSGLFQLGTSSWALPVGQTGARASSWALLVGHFQLGASSWALPATVALF